MPYVTVDDIRAAGLTSYSLDDDTVEAGIELWSEIVERYCRQFFEPRVGDILLDGTDSDALHLHIPIISISAIYLNNDTVACDPRYYRVYNGRGGISDDRKNPRIKLINNGYGDIYTASYGSTYFRKGRQNQRVVGTFGYVQEDGSTPLAIKRAVTKLVISKLVQPIYVDPNDPTPAAPLALPPITNSGVVTDEWTDWHRLRFADITSPLPKRADGMSDVIPDPEVRGILKLYRAPLAMNVPANASWR